MKSKYDDLFSQHLALKESSHTDRHTLADLAELETEHKL